MSFAQNFKRIKEIQNISNYKIAKHLNCSQSTVANWLAGKSEPTPKHIESLTTLFNVSIDDLLGNEDRTKNIKNILPYPDNQSLIPVLGEIHAGCPSYATECIEGYELADVKNPDEYFYLRVVGESMINAGIFEGALVLIHKQNYANNGDIVACLVNGDDATLKRFTQQKKTIILTPENSSPAYKPIILSTDDFENGYACILGVAKEVKFKL